MIANSMHKSNRRKISKTDFKELEENSKRKSVEEFEEWSQRDPENRKKKKKITKNPRKILDVERIVLGRES